MKEACSWEKEVGRWMGFKEEIIKMQEKRKIEADIVEEENRSKRNKKKINIKDGFVPERMKVNEEKEEEIIRMVKPDTSMGDFF
jgi:hypothetical protein